MKRTVRNPVKQQEVVAAMRARVGSGAWRPAERLPPRQVLMRQFHASSITVQRACDQLVTEKFLETNPRVGTFVHPHPPNLCAYGLVLNEGPRGKEGGLRFQALLMAAERLSHQRPNLRFPRFEGFNSFLDYSSYQSLAAAIADERLAGLIFLNTPYPFAGTPVLHTPGLPRVAFSTGAPAPVVALADREANPLNGCLEACARYGCRRPALVAAARGGGVALDPVRLESALSRFGLVLAKHGMLAVPYDSPRFTENTMQLLLRQPPPERPDAVIVLDDNLTADVAAGILATGLRVPADLRLLSIANFPTPPSVTCPVTFAGYDFQAGLETAVATIDRMKREPGWIPTSSDDGSGLRVLVKECAPMGG